MLPTRGLKLAKETEELLRRLKLKAKVTPNVASRLAFFKSVESGYRYHDTSIKLDGSLVLDKVTWLGDLTLAIDCTLLMLYPSLDSKELEKAWATHVQHGVKTFRSAKSLVDLI
ncbi:DNA sulfur modification protein DndE [Shewanella baltica]|uniref:DNA sulfur modification protein DndE n=1 Tax=Shewanella baltica TaxID=62322 RepID=UPI00217DB1B6|nr:DNA sulfur modification protein DndE [Shewanella baltica]MCS6258425.1 DNA sulfur modification protein DndE [Shewanella baltica]